MSGPGVLVATNPPRWWVVVGMLATSVLGCGPGSRGSPPGVSPGADLPFRTATVTPPYEAAADSARLLLGDAAEVGVGVAAAVVVEGEMVWLAGAGYADREARTAVDPRSTRFRIYSVTKPMTAAAAARLMERNALDPSAAVQHYVPSYSGAEPITPMQLATHTSGIRHYADEDEANSRRHCERVEDALPIFQSDPLVHAPGASETYSSWGFVLLSAVIEGASGSSYPEAMEALVFEPAVMSRTVLDDPTENVDRRATFYEELEGDVRTADPVDNTCKWGAGAYLSTAGDVARFGSAMLDPQFLSPTSLELFMQGEDLYRAQGVGAGAAAFLVVDRAESLSVALLSNAIGERAGPAARQAVDRIHQLFRQHAGDPD